jgi:hypothetical protein
LKFNLPEIFSTVIRCFNVFYNDWGFSASCFLRRIILPHPFIPSPARGIIDNQSFSWLERGIKKRGGLSPPLKSSPSKLTRGI